MRLLPLLAALTISMTATSCGNSSIPLFSDPPAMQAAEARLDKALDCPQPAPILTLCQDGSLPFLQQNPDGTRPYTCHWAQIDAEMASGVPLKSVLADTIGALHKEVDARFQLLHAGDSCRASTTPPPSSAPTPAAAR